LVLIWCKRIAILAIIKNGRYFKFIEPNSKRIVAIKSSKQIRFIKGEHWINSVAINQRVLYKAFPTLNKNLIPIKSSQRGLLEPPWQKHNIPLFLHQQFKIMFPDTFNTDRFQKQSSEGVVDCHAGSQQTGIIEK
jgi:hypothetical protein